jgi:hypothetical protein
MTARRGTFRSRFTDTEWAIYKAGRCCWQTAYGTPHIRYCRKRSKRGQRFGFCAQHDRELVEGRG